MALDTLPTGPRPEPARPPRTRRRSTVWLFPVIKWASCLFRLELHDAAAEFVKQFPNDAHEPQAVFWKIETTRRTPRIWKL